MLYIMKNKVSTMSKKICQKIRLERVKRNLTQEKLAELANVSRATIGNIERADVSPTIDTINQLAEAFGIPFLELLDVSKFEI